MTHRSPILEGGNVLCGGGCDLIHDIGDYFTEINPPGGYGSRPAAGVRRLHAVRPLGLLDSQALVREHRAGLVGLIEAPLGNIVRQADQARAEFRDPKTPLSQRRF